MAERNLLLGKGEALASSKEIKRNSGPKKYPYTLEEIRTEISSSLEQVQLSLSALPKAAKPRGEGVFELTLHPAFLAKSYFPKRILKKAGLRDVGSKETSIVPRHVTDIRDAGKLQATATLFIAGTESAVANLRGLLKSSDIPAALEKSSRRSSRSAGSKTRTRFGASFHRETARMPSKLPCMPGPMKKTSLPLSLTL